MSSSERPFLDFYEKHSVIPTKLNTPDQYKFFKQRDFLFETLGVPTHFLRGTNILELGPGTGQKATHLLSLNPGSYTAVDYNQESIKSTKKVIEQSGFQGLTKIVSADFLDYDDKMQYDLVIAELVIPTQSDPILFLRKLSEQLVAGGLLIFTCMDPVSLLSETLRNALVKNLHLIDDDLRLSAERITNFFRKDLDLLPGMNRQRSDWAIDQIIKPPVGPLLNIPTALNSLANIAVFHGSSPRFLEDFRWYKSPKISIDNLNDVAQENYWEKCHNFLDFRSEVTSKPENNKKLFDLSHEIYSEVHENVWTKASLETILFHCIKIKTQISEVLPLAAESLDSFITYGTSKNINDLDKFRPWWGRGTQYVSVVKL